MDNNEVTVPGYTTATEDLDEILCFSDKAAIQEPFNDVTPVQLPELLKQNWIEKSKKLWDLSNINEIRSRVKNETMCLEIHVYGSVGEGYGAILRDFRMVPIAARSRSLSESDSVSELYITLNAVALAAKLALDYQVLNFYLYVPSFYFYNVVMSIWHPYLRYESPPSEHVGSIDDLEMLLHHEDKGNIQDIHRLISSIIDDLKLLRPCGMKYLLVQPIFDPDDNKAAEFLAKLGEDRDMKFAEIFENEKLSDILFEDAFS